MANIIDDTGVEHEAGAPAPVPPKVKTKRLKQDRIGRKQPPVVDQRRRLTVVSGVCAALAVAGLGLGAWQTATARQYAETYESNLVEVVSTQADVAAGDVIETSNLVTVKVPKNLAPADAVKADESGLIAGHRACANITAGNAISASTVQASAVASTITHAPDSDKVAYMVALDGSASMSPLLHVGDVVDILTGSDGNETDFVAEKVKILALDAAMSNSSEASGGYSTVTLELTSEQAKELYTITNVSGGSIKLVAPAAVDDEGNVDTGAYGTGDQKTIDQTKAEAETAAAAQGKE